MAKMIRHDFGSIHDALNKMIIAEVKTALEQLPEKCIATEDWRVPLCRIVVSDGYDYNPTDLGVRRVWLDEGGELNFSEYTVNQDKGGIYDYTENDDLLDITDFGYLIDQIAEQVEDDKTYNLPNKSLLTCGYAAELELGTAVEKTVTV
jgi:hypothetical protein